MLIANYSVQLVQFSRSVVSDSLRPHEVQHARSPCRSPTPRVYSNSCPSNRWCHPAFSSSVVPFSSCPQSIPASGSFPVSQLFAWGGQSIGVSASASVLPINTQVEKSKSKPQRDVNYSVQFSCSIVSASLLLHGLQYTRPPCPSPTPRVHSNSCPLSRWCHPTTSSSVVPFSSCPQSFPASGIFPMSQFFTSGGQSTGVSASTSVLPLTIQD